MDLFRPDNRSIVTDQRIYRTRILPQLGKMTCTGAQMNSSKAPASMDLHLALNWRR
ncbi:hypothetical protein CFII64_07225 [Pseudomonas sp. CFII64]|jgi:hypothetical protein|nr:hypothetical protein CFII64_07225 [Pseudomonas sp. CFII64]